MLTLGDLAKLHQQYGEHGAAEGGRVREFDLLGRRLPFNSRPVLMGVVNLSPDSWYRESVCLSADQAIRRGQVLAAQGAEIIDVGAESTLAHADRPDLGLQESRLQPVVRGLSEAGIPVSVETYQPAVTRLALEAGASVLNLTGPEHASEIYRLAADHDAAVIICYVQGRHVRDVDAYSLAADPIQAMREYFARELDSAEKIGLRKIAIDPGLGFYYPNLQDSAVRIRFQMRTFLNTFRLRSLGFPICHALPHAFEIFGEEVRLAESFFAVLAALGRTDLFRTHEVPRVKAVLETLGLWSSVEDG